MFFVYSRERGNDSAERRAYINYEYIFYYFIYNNKITAKMEFLVTGKLERRDLNSESKQIGRRHSNLLRLAILQ